MSKTLSTKYYQENNKRLQKKRSLKISKSKEEKEKSSNMVVDVTKTSQDEKQKLAEYRKNYY